jgi:hypothetical protein
METNLLLLLTTIPYELNSIDHCICKPVLQSQAQTDATTHKLRTFTIYYSEVIQILFKNTN